MQNSLLLLSLLAACSSTSESPPASSPSAEPRPADSEPPQPLQEAPTTDTEPQDAEQALLAAKQAEVEARRREEKQALLLSITGRSSVGGSTRASSRSSDDLFSDLGEAASGAGQKQCLALFPERNEGLLTLGAAYCLARLELGIPPSRTKAGLGIPEMGRSLLRVRSPKAGEHYSESRVSDMRHLRGLQVFEVRYLSEHSTRGEVWHIDAKSGAKLHGWTGPGGSGATLFGDAEDLFDLTP